MRLTHSAVVSKAYVRCREAIVEGSKLITGRFGNAAVRCHALDALSIRAVAVCVPLLLCAGWRQRTDCVVPSLLLKTGINTLTLARPREQVRQSALHGKKKLRPLFSWSRDGGNTSTVPCCWVLAADGSLSSRVRHQYII